ncbi:MAG: integrase arm-type DNA-binding domain-containing protein, partial [Desulfamplus sp.]|nr:integrase arm-type DNA-binding domain-containing protein [Desulfamplus sp.]
MPKKKAGLTITEIKYLKPKEKIYKVFDGGGLYLAITPSGGKLWNIKYRFKGKSKKISIGSYPAVSLSLARDKLKEIKELIALDTDPMEQRKDDKTEIIEKDVNTFGNICLEWFEQQSSIWAIGHAKKIQGGIDNDIKPFIGTVPIKEISAPDILSLLRRVESRGAFETAHRIKTII